MAEDEKASEEEAHPAPEKKPGKRSRKGEAVDLPVSLFPLSFEDAVDGLLQVKPEPAGKTSRPDGVGKRLK